MELQELAQRIRRGDRDALKSLISEYGVGIYQKAYQKTQDKVLAREATRQTFAQLVTALQEQTDMDGWELWLNALAKKNIDTYCNIGADMAYLENQLDTALFSPTAQVPPTAKTATDAIQSEAMKRFAMQQQAEVAKRQYEAQQAQLLAAQEAQRQYEAQQAQLLAAQEAQRQYEAQQAQLLAKQEAQRQYEAQQIAARQIAAEPSAQPMETPAAPAEQVVRKPQEEQAERLPERKTAQRKERRKDGEKPHTGSTWPVIALLVLLCVVLVWLVMGVAMSLGWLPKLELGYTWFNEHILELF